MGAYLDITVHHCMSGVVVQTDKQRLASYICLLSFGYLICIPQRSSVRQRITLKPLCKLLPRMVHCKEVLVLLQRGSAFADSVFFVTIQGMSLMIVVKSLSTLAPIPLRIDHAFKQNTGAIF